MRFISIFTHEPTNRPPTEAEMATMGKLIEEGMKAGWLIATEGVDFGARAFAFTKAPPGRSRSPTAPSPRRRRSSAAMRCSKPLTRMRWLSSRDIS